MTELVGGNPEFERGIGEVAAVLGGEALRALDREHMIIASGLVDVIRSCEGLGSDDMYFLADLYQSPDEGDFIGAAVNYLYGRLLEEGYDPDEVLRRAGIKEEDSEV